METLRAAALVLDALLVFMTGWLLLSREGVPREVTDWLLLVTMLACPTANAAAILIRAR